MSSLAQNRKRLTKVLDSYDIYYVHANDLDIRHNQIYLGGVDRVGDDETEEPGVDFMMANRFTKNLNLAQLTNRGAPILIHMSTCGGDWNFGMQIYDAIKACENHVTIVNYTHARSMSSIIFQAADWRVMMPNSHFMFHLGEGSVAGTHTQIDSGWSFYKRGTDTMLDIYVAAMKQKGEMKDKSEKQIKTWLRRQMDKKEDVFLTAEDAVRLGFADEIFQGWGDYLHRSTYKPKIPTNLSKSRRKTKSSGR